MSNINNIHLSTQMSISPVVLARSLLGFHICLWQGHYTFQYLHPSGMVLAYCAIDIYNLPYMCTLPLPHLNPWTGEHGYMRQ